MERIQAAIEKARALRESQPLPDPAAAPAAPDVLQTAEDMPPRDKQPKEAGKAAPEPREPRSDRLVEAAAKARARTPETAPQTPPAPARPRALPLGRAESREDQAQTHAPLPPRPATALPLTDVPRPHSAPRAPRFHLTNARSAWGELKPYKPDAARMRASRIVSYERADPAHIAYDMMRTRLLQFMRSNGWTSVAITSPTAGCGKTTTCLNLAFSLAYQQDTRTVLMDVDLRRPAIAERLGIAQPHSMSRILDGTGQIEDHFLRYGETLAIGSNDHPSRYPSELLQHQAAGTALEAIRTRLGPDIILYDMPPMMSNDDVMAFLPHVDCVLLVAAAESSTIDEIDRCERELGAQTNVLGVILNKCRYTTEKYGYY